MSAIPKPIKTIKPKRPIKRAGRPRQMSPRPRAVETRQKDADWSRMIRERAGGRCEWCRHHGTATPGVDAHHICGKKAHPKLRHDPDNGISLCRPCHRTAHAMPGVFATFLVNRRRRRDGAN